MDWIAIRKEYESTEITLKELATKHGISEGTMRSRKNREKWQRTKETGTQCNATPSATQRKKQRATKKENVATRGETPKRDAKVKVIVNSKEVEVEENPELTEKQRLFCLYFVKYWNATKAYQKVYNCSYLAARVEGCRSLAKPNVKKEIENLKQDIRDGIVLEVMAVLQKYIDIAFSDITDFIEFGSEEEYVIVKGQRLKDENGKYIKRPVNYINIKNHNEIDGSLIGEVKEGKEGISIKLHDKMKALEVLTKYLDLLPDHHKRRIEDEKLKLEQAKFDLEKKKTDDPEETPDDGFLEALAGKGDDAWSDSEDIDDGN